MTKWGLEFDSPLSTGETVALINVPWEVHHGHDWVMHEPPQATRNLDELHRISNNPGQHLSHFFFFFRYIIIQSQILLLLIFLFGSQLSYFHSRNFFLTHVLLNLLSPFINSCPVTSGKSFFSLLTFFISPISPKTAMLRLVAKREYSKYS